MCEGDYAPEWLPALIEFNDYANWADYLEALYAVFKRDFLTDKTYFDNRVISIRRQPVVDGKEGMFWHLLGHEASQTFPDDFNRHKHITWPKPIIVHHSEGEWIKVWSHSDFKGAGLNRQRVNIWFNDEYLVVLEPREKYISLITAYPTDVAHTVRKLEKSYERSRFQ